MKNREKEDRQSGIKISNLKDQVEDLKKKLEIEQAQTSLAKEMSSKITNLQKKSSNLSEIYKTITPQIQCPYGH